jgi:histidinol-phosphate aminotransferase
MNAFNRRDWIRTAGLGGIAALAGAWKYPLNPLFQEYAKEGVAQLSSNENPFGPSPKVREAMKDAFDLACRYPQRHWNKLVEKLAQREGVSPDNIVVTCGSREGLQLTGIEYGLNGGEILTPQPTYWAMMDYAEQFGARINAVPLDKDLQIDLPAMERRISHNTRLVFVCNPNNPTGALLPAKAMRDFCERVSDRTIVFSDEAYYDYVTDTAYPSMVELVKEGRNVVVSRTFSKVYGLAGIRVGYLVARADIAARLRARVTGGLNMLAVYAALSALEDESFRQFSLQKNEAGRQYLYGLFKELNLRFIPSHANFVFFHTGKDINQLMPFFRERGVMIGRPFPPLTDWCRISTGTMEDLEKFGSVLKEYPM